MKIGRREFLGGAVAGVGSVLVGGQAAAGGAVPANFDPCEMVPLGKTGVRVSRVGFGTGMRGGRRQSNQTRLGKEKFEALLKHAYDRGVRLYDVADTYGTHPYVARALGKMPRDKYVLVTKIWLHRGGLPERERPPADVTVRRFLKELKTEYIDVVLLHCQWSEKWPQIFRKDMDRLAKLKKKGVVRACGVSIHSLKALEAAAEEPWVDSVHVRINPYGTCMDGPAETVAPIVKKIHQAGKGVIGMKLVGEGQFRHSDEKRDTSVRYVLNLGCVDAMVVGFEKPAEVDDFAARVRKVPRPGAGERG